MYNRNLFLNDRPQQVYKLPIHQLPSRNNEMPALYLPTPARDHPIITNLNIPPLQP